MENVSWKDRVRIEEVRQSVKEVRRAICIRKRGEADWLGHVWRRNCLLKHVIGGKINGRTEVNGRRGRRSKQLLDDLQEKRKALYRTLWSG